MRLARLVDAHDGEGSGSFDRAERTNFATADRDRGAGYGQGTLGGDRHQPATCRRAVLHARDDFLADIAALLEIEPAIAVHHQVMRKEVGRVAVFRATGNAIDDTQRGIGGEGRFPGST